MLVLALLVTVVGGACGARTQTEQPAAEASDDGHDHASHDHSDGDADDDGSASTQPTTTPPTTQVPDDNSAPATPPTASDEQVSAAAIPPGGNTLPLEVTVASNCIKPGDEQTIVVRSDPRVEVGYVTNYEDGNTAFFGDAYYGGTGGGQADGSGAYRDTWKLKETATPGEADVIVRVRDAGDHEAGKVINFSVAGPTGECD